MKPRNVKPAARGARVAGNTLLVVLLTIAVLSLVAGNLMWSASSRYHVTYQSSSWQESLVAAEAGVDVAMVELRNHLTRSNYPVFSGPGWTTGNARAVYDGSKTNVRALLGGAVDPLRLPTADNRVNPDLGIFPDNGHALPLRALPGRAGEGNTTLAYRVYVDVPGSDDVTTNPVTPGPLGQLLAQLAPGLQQPLDPSLQFINLPDSGLNDLDTHGRRVNMSRWWWRIRAVGYSGVSGPARPGPDGRDGRLRRFSFFSDWRDGSLPWLPGQPLTAAVPQVSRVVEVLVQPRARVNYALLGDTGIELNGRTVRVDSYDSSKGDYANVILPPNTSESGNGYTAPGSVLDPNGNVNLGVLRNVGWMGNVATSGQLANASGASFLGDALTNNGAVSDERNVTGTEDPNFFQDLTPVKAQDWTSVALKPTITASTSFNVANSDPNDPLLLHLNGVNLNNGAVVNLTAPAEFGYQLPIPLIPLPATQRFVKIYVEGDILTNGTGCIRLAPNVSAIIYVEGRVSLAGIGIDNQSKKPTHLVINGVQPSDGTAGGAAHSITISPYGSVTSVNLPVGEILSTLDPGSKKKTPPPPLPSLIPNGDFAGVVYAPHHDLYLGGSGTLLGNTVGYYDFAGAFAARKITVNVNAAVHFDEGLRDASQPGGYRLMSWFEDTATRLSR